MLDVVSRFRVLVAAFSIAVFVFMFVFANLCCVPWSVGWLRLVDLAFWILSMGSMFAGFAEFWLFWRGCPALSTLLIDVVGLGIVVFARLSSAIYSQNSAKPANIEPMERIQKAKSTSLSQPTDQGTQQRLAKTNISTKTAIEKATTRTLNR